ncbi:MAG TPA: type 2 lanthipeptide synthetase LanM [Kineosporiaceae bacterium]|nr:type 2 lanthipeptide synthetase LanM [Kineosporiaceae bacterium]
MSGSRVAVEAFLPFYRHVISRENVRDRLHAPAAEVTAAQASDTLVEQIWQELSARVEQHAFRVLIGEFHQFRQARGLPMTSEGDEALQDFRRRLAEPGTCEAILDHHPVLRQRLRVVLDNSLAAYAEVLTGYAQDRPELDRAGLVGGEDDPIVGFFGTGADLHNGNRQVVGLQLGSGRKVMYKPRALVSDGCVRDLFTVAEARLAHSLTDCLPTSVTIGSRGWQAFIAPAAMTEADQPARYFYRFGALAAILGAIGASDLHGENLLAAGEYPCLIDTETVIRPNTGVDSDSLPHTLINQLKRSVGPTMLVPMTNPNSPLDLMMAGVGVEGEQVSKLRRPVIRDHETDAISVRWEQVTYRHKDNMARLGPDALSAIDHFDHVLAGYSDSLAVIREEDLAKVLARYRDMPVRCLIRSTMVYTRFLDAATHPDYLRTEEERDRLLRLLGSYPDYLGEQAAEYVGGVEREDLHTGNVPYFVARAGSTELGTLHSGFPGVHRSSPLDFAGAGLVANARQSDQYHHFLLEECFGELAADHPTGLSRNSVFAPAVAAAASGGWWQDIARTVTAIGVTHEGTDGPETGWVCGIGPDRGAPTLTPGNFISFHDVGGVVTFLGNAARRDRVFQPASDSARRGLASLFREYEELLVEVPEAAFTGAASALLISPSAVPQGWLPRLFDKLRARVAAGAVPADLSNGPAGLLMLLLSGHGGGRHPSDLPVRSDLRVGSQQVAELRDVVLSQLGAGRKAPWFDVAHGDAGMRWAVARLGGATADAELVVSSADWLSERLDDDGIPPVAGWCNGAAGLLLAAAEILTAADRVDGRARDWFAALADGATRLPADRSVDLSVCHGTSGVVQSLLAAARLLGDRSMVDRALDYQDRVIATVRRIGFHTGTAGRTSLLGYMLGWSGVGDTDLMLRSAAEGDDTFAVPVAFLPHGSTYYAATTIPPAATDRQAAPHERPSPLMSRVP